MAKSRNADGEEMPLGVERELGMGDDGRAHDDPPRKPSLRLAIHFTGRSRPARRPGQNGHFLGIELALGAEAAADIGSR